MQNPWFVYCNTSL